MNALPAKQKGVAIITALLIVAIATVISADIATELQLDVRRTSNMISNEQFLQYNLAAEKLAVEYLRQDHDDNNYDYLGEDWALEDGYAFPLKDGIISGKITDLHRCINLNALYQDGQIDPVTQTRLQALLTNLQLDPSLANAIIDWIDDDQQTAPNGAEDLYYTSLQQPYRAANSAMQNISELKLVKGFEDIETYNTLAPFVCAFGVPGVINVNTAPAEVLSSLGNNINAQDIIDERENTDGFETITNFLAFGNLKTTITDTKDLLTSSEYFLLESTYVYENSQVRTTMFSIMHRDENGETSVIARSQGVF